MKLTPIQQKLILENRRLAHKVAEDFIKKNAKVYFEDIQAIAYEGLCRASLYYKPYCEYSFSTYAVKVIRAHLLKSLPSYLFALSFPKNVLLPKVRSKVCNDYYTSLSDGYGKVTTKEYVLVNIMDTHSVEDNLEKFFNLRVLIKVIDRFPKKLVRDTIKKVWGLPPYGHPISMLELAKQEGVSYEAIRNRIHRAKIYYRDNIGEKIDFYI
ncbi:MAG: hypothetical protein NC218_08455 [Acetobacter sp.]|nr:hypothetical protein [Acetobacter sp.]